MRKRELNLVVGQKGCGKTYFLKEIAKKHLAKGENVLVVVPMPLLWEELPTVSSAREIFAMKGQAAKLVYNFEKPNLSLIKAFHDGVLILEDARAFSGAATLPELNYIYSLNRHAHIDVYFVAHGFNALPPQCFVYAQWLILFYSSIPIKLRKEYIDDDILHKIEAAQTQVKRQVQAGNPYAHIPVLLDEQVRSTYEQNRAACKPTKNAERDSK